MFCEQLVTFWEKSSLGMVHIQRPQLDKKGGIIGTGAGTTVCAVYMRIEVFITAITAIADAITNVPPTDIYRTSILIHTMKKRKWIRTSSGLIGSIVAIGIIIV
jgi:hypothetical protein